MLQFCKVLHFRFEVARFVAMNDVAFHILRETKTIAVVGLSPKPERPSHEVACYLQAQGYRIVPVNPGMHGKLLLGEMCFASLREAASALAPKGVQIDLVDCFRQSEEIAAIAEDAVAIGARFLWMQIGITNPDAARRAEAAGLLVVQDRCTKTEHRRLQAQRLAL